jgi:hypothetical protein
VLINHQSQYKAWQQNYDFLFFKWTGDSRAVLCRAGQAIPLTDDHKAAREDETVNLPYTFPFLAHQSWSATPTNPSFTTLLIIVLGFAKHIPLLPSLL